MTSAMSWPALVEAVVDGIEPLVRRNGGGSRLVIVETDAGFSFHEVRRGKAVPLAEGDPDARAARRLRKAATGPVELRLAPERLIRRTLQLPAAGRDYLGPIIEHRLERLTPWKPEKVLYGYAPAGEPAADGTMAVEFVATSADIAADRSARLAALEITPTALGSSDEPIDRPLRIDLWRGTRDVGRRRLRRAVGFAAVIAALLLVPSVAASQWMLHSAETRLADIEQRLATKRQVLRAATGETEAQARDLRLVNAKTPDTATMVLIDRLATMLPDDTHLRELEIDGPELRIAGLSADAPALIPVLEADEALADVRFAAPVVRDENGRDGFDIVARWVPREAPADGGPGTGAPLDPFRTGALP